MYESQGELEHTVTLDQYRRIISERDAQPQSDTEPVATRQSQEQPIPAVVDWRAKAACNGLNGYLFLPPSSNERPKEKKEREAEAIKVCNSPCRVKEQCLEDALSRRDYHSVAGGLTTTQLTKVLGIGPHSKKRDQHRKEILGY